MMKKILFISLALFILIASDTIGQVSVNLPWMFYPQQDNFSKTSYCIKYNCGNTQFKKSKQGFVINNHSLFHTYWGDNPNAQPFNKIYSASYTVSTIRYSIFPKEKLGAIFVEFSMNPEVRYGKILTDDFRKNTIDSETYAIVSDFLFSIVGKRYSKQQIISCYKLKKNIYKSFDEFFAPPNTPIRKLPLQESGPGAPNILISVGCNDANSESQGSTLFEIRLSGIAALEGVKFPN
jgi:hypothetical protein